MNEYIRGTSVADIGVGHCWLSLRTPQDYNPLYCHWIPGSNRHAVGEGESETIRNRAQISQVVEKRFRGLKYAGKDGAGDPD